MALVARSLRDLGVGAGGARLAAGAPPHSSKASSPALAWTSRLYAPRSEILSRFSAVSAPLQVLVSALGNGRQAPVPHVPGSAQSGRCYRPGLFAIGCAQSVMLRRDPDSREFKMRLDLRFRAGMRSSMMPFSRRRDRENKPLLALAAAAGAAAALIMAAPGLSAAAAQATGFRPATEWSSHMCLAGEFCAMGDVNGDGRADAIAFTQGGNPWRPARQRLRGPVDGPFLCHPGRMVQRDVSGR